MEELYKFTLLTRDLQGYLTDRYSERREREAKDQQAKVEQAQSALSDRPVDRIGKGM